PPIVAPCFYGIDFAAEDELVAAARTVEEVRERIGATSLAYISLEGLQAATRRPASALCRACLTRDYPTRVPAALKLPKRGFREVEARTRPCWRGRGGHALAPFVGEAPRSARPRELLRPPVADGALHRPRVEAALEELLAQLALGRHSQEEPGESRDRHERPL